MLYEIVATLLIGGLAGWLAGLLLRGRGCGCIGNIIVGIIGSYIGLFIFKFLNLPVVNNWEFLIASIVGALLLLAVAGFSRRN